MRKILIIFLLILIIAVVIIISVNVSETGPSKASTEELVEILVNKEVATEKKIEVLTAISQRELLIPIDKLVQFINDINDSTEINKTSKIYAINLLRKDTTAESIIAVANLLKTQSNLEIRNHIVNILSNKALEKEISSALIDTLSKLRSSDALLIMTNRLAIDKDRKIRDKIKQNLSTTPALHLILHLQKLAGNADSPEERQDIEDIIASIQQNAASSDTAVSIARENNPEAYTVSFSCC